MISQNCRFNANIPDDAEFDHPQGAWLARTLDRELRDNWHTTGFENWRDTGWSIACTKDKSQLQISFCQIADNEWMLQISPQYVTGFIGGLLGKQNSASPEEVQRLAQDCHSILSSLKDIEQTMWCWDGFPEQGNSTSTPQLKKPKLSKDFTVSNV